MDDLISRQAAIEGKICIQRSNGVEIYDDYAVPVEYLEQLPPAQLGANLAEVGTDAISRDDVLRIVDYYGQWNDYHGREREAIEQLPPIQPEPHWIPVTERLPEKHGAYIVCYSDFRHGIYYGRVIAVAWFDVEDTWLKYRYADNARTFPPRLHHVIAWMPLPEPYKGVTT